MAQPCLPGGRSTLRLPPTPTPTRLKHRAIRCRSPLPSRVGGSQVVAASRDGLVQTSLPSWEVLPTPHGPQEIQSGLAMSAVEPHVQSIEQIPAVSSDSLASPQMDPQAAVTCTLLLLTFGYVRLTTTAAMSARGEVRKAEEDLKAVKLEQLTGGKTLEDVKIAEEAIADLEAREMDTATLVKINGVRIAIPWRTRTGGNSRSNPAGGNKNRAPDSTTNNVSKDAEQETPLWVNIVLPSLLLMLLFSFVGLLSGDSLQPPPDWIMDMAEDLEALP
mmetsp:Transcript_13776/g.16594  ORF Transcript_13776/g.16594 Transcript_13776/m.16594 type:complete len:275 (+) Transcript_13776:277-1101(+)